MGFLVDGVAVDAKYMLSVIDAIGPRRFVKANPWIIPLLKDRRPKKRRMTADQRHTKTVLAHAHKEMARDLRDVGWTWSQIAQLGIKQKALDKKRRIARDIDFHKFRPVKCRNCGYVFETASPTDFSCPACGQHGKTATSIETSEDTAYEVALDNLNNSFQYGKTPRKRHYEQDSKKKVLATPA